MGWLLYWFTGYFDVGRTRDHKPQDLSPQKKLSSKTLDECATLPYTVTCWKRQRGGGKTKNVHICFVFLGLVAGSLPLVGLCLLQPYLSTKTVTGYQSPTRMFPDMVCVVLMHGVLVSDNSHSLKTKVDLYHQTTLRCLSVLINGNVTVAILSM